MSCASPLFLTRFSFIKCQQALLHCCWAMSFVPKRNTDLICVRDSFDSLEFSYFTTFSGQTLAKSFSSSYVWTAIHFCYEKFEKYDNVVSVKLSNRIGTHELNVILDAFTPNAILSSINVCYFVLIEGYLSKSFAGRYNCTAIGIWIEWRDRRLLQGQIRVFLQSDYRIKV